MPDAGAAPAKGHNSAVEVSDDQIRAWVARIERKKGVKDVAASQLNTERKEARAAGIRLETLKWAMKLREMEREEAEAILEHLQAYLRALHAPVGRQMAFNFDGAVNDDRSDEEIEARATESAFSDGHIAGLRGGDPKENPHAGNTRAGQEWLAGFHEGAKVLEFAESLGGEVGEPALKKRGRKPRMTEHDEEAKPDDEIDF